MHLTYYIEFITPRDIGKSKFYNRYYINRFDSIIDKDHVVKSYNVYDGRTRYNSITEKDQIRTVINILSQVYTSGKRDYRDCITQQPFCSLLEKLNTFQDNFHDRMLDYLMTDYGFLQSI